MKHATAAVLALVALLSVAGCSGNDEDVPEVAHIASKTPVSDPTTANQVDAYLANRRELAKCFRDNGLPDTKDPDELGQFNISVGGPNGQRALTACAALGRKTKAAPPEIQERIRAQQAASMTPAQKQFERDLASCLRENGIGDWPDPQADGTRGVPAWELPNASVARPSGLDDAVKTCNKLLGNTGE